MTPYTAQPIGSIRESGRRLPGTARLLIVANRLPWTVRVDRGSARLSPSSGGLATGLSSVQNEWGGIWIGWPGIAASTQCVSSVWLI